MPLYRVFPVVIVVIVSLGLVTNAFSGESIGSDKIKEMLLRPGGWLVEWRSTFAQGRLDFILEARGDSIVVKINNESMRNTCERDVTITSDVIKFDACIEENITLVYDPDDHEYPFKGGSQGTRLKLKEKSLFNQPFLDPSPHHRYNMPEPQEGSADS